jgi:hypothetical protein
MHGFTVCRRLPDVDGRSGDGLASLHVCDLTVHESNLCIFGGFEADGRAVWPHWVVFPPKRTQDGRSRQAA